MHRDDRCPHCGRPYVSPEFYVSGIVGPRIAEIIRTRSPYGITRWELMEVIYGGCPDGAKTPNVIAVHIKRINRQLLPQGYEIKRSWMGRGNRYFMVKHAYPVSKPTGNIHPGEMGRDQPTERARHH